MSSTAFGIRILNPIRIAIENRFVASRVVIDPGKPEAALDQLAKHLERNRIVSITVGAEAKRISMLPFGPGKIPLAGGAASLSIKSAAQLLPVFVWRRDNGGFVVSIEAPLAAHPDRCHDDQVAMMLRQQVALMYRHFQRYPTQFPYLGLHRIGDMLTSVERAKRAGKTFGVASGKLSGV